MPLFDIIKDPERAAEQSSGIAEIKEALIEVAAQLDEETSELEELRARARAADRTREVVFSLDATAEGFLQLCLDRAKVSSGLPYLYDAETEDDFDTRGAVRVVAVAVLNGDWPHVLSGRESALATVAELTRRGFSNPRHDYRRVSGRWVLRIRFGF